MVTSTLTFGSNRLNPCASTHERSWLNSTSNFRPSCGGPYGTSTSAPKLTPPPASNTIGMLLLPIAPLWPIR